MQIVQRWALAAIRAYQRHLSPRKRFCCAYRLHTGRASCSNLGLRVIRRYGVLDGLALLRQRLYLCGVTYRRHSPQGRYRPLRQQGFCDVGCDVPVDVDCDVCGNRSCNALDILSNCGNCCSWETFNRRPNDKEQFVYIPPKPRKHGQSEQDHRRNMV